MNLKVTLLSLLVLLIGSVAQAQDWKWPADEATATLAKEKNAAYVDYMKSEQYVEATKPLHWLLVNTPDLNESLYINGVKIYDAAQLASQDATKKVVYQDSVMALYEKRGQLYHNPEKWMENKAYYGYKYYKDVKTKIGTVVSDFEKAIEINGELSLPNLYAAYFDAVYRNEGSNDVYSDDEILEKYNNVQKLIAKAEGQGKDVKTANNQVEAVLVAMDLINCDFIENKMGPKLTADPANLDLAQEIFNYSVQYKCYSSNSFKAALELIDTQNPTFATSQVRAMLYMASGDFDQAGPILEKAFTLAGTDEQKGEVKMELAKVYTQSGQKSAARAAAKEAAALNSDMTASAYSLIGDLYMSSFNDCKGGESRAKDQSVFIAAFVAYQKAGDSEGMGDARSRFPTKEELFTEGFQPGATMSTGCWIGETVALATRD